MHFSLWIKFTDYMKSMGDEALPSFLKIRSFFQACMEEGKYEYENTLPFALKLYIFCTPEAFL